MLDFDQIIQRFSEQKIVIVGDPVADQFLRGTISRVSREAPVFILRHNETETLAGGAANAAVNVASLGAKAVLAGFIGKDSNGEALLKSLDAANVDHKLVVASDKLQTTTKVRVIAGQHYATRQQVIRIDYENTGVIDAELKDQLEKNIRRAVADADAIIISDYNYGAANPETAASIFRTAHERKIPVIVDSRFRLQEFRGATSATPNQDEVEQILGENFTEQDCVGLCERLGFESLMVTRGNQGMMLLEKGKKPVYLPAVGAKEPIDVTGAGDTVIAVYALALAAGLNFAEAAELANYAGGIVVMKKGTASVSLSELKDSIEQSKQLLPEKETDRS